MQSCKVIKSSMLLRLKTLLTMLIVLLLLKLPRSSARKPAKLFLFRSVETNYNPEYIDNYYGNVTIDRTALNMGMNLIKTTPVDIWMKVAISYRRKAQKKFLPIVTFNMNACSLLSSLLDQKSLVHMLIRNVLKYSNMPLTCPWKPGYYHWRNFQPENGNIPIFAFSGMYRFNSTFYFKELQNKLFANITVVFDKQ